MFGSCSESRLTLERSSVRQMDARCSAAVPRLGLSRAGCATCHTLAPAGASRPPTAASMMLFIRLPGGSGMWSVRSAWQWSSSTGEWEQYHTSNCGCMNRIRHQNHSYANTGNPTAHTSSCQTYQAKGLKHPPPRMQCISSRPCTPESSTAFTAAYELGGTSAWHSGITYLIILFISLQT